MIADLTNKNSLTRRRVLRAGAAVALLPVLTSLGAGLARAELTGEDAADVKRVEDYINSIGTLRASFQQVDPNQAISTGRIYLRRPGRMRVEYDPPNPILIIADGVLISQVDRKIGELSQMPLKQSTAWFLLRDPIEIGDQITVTDVKKTPAELSVTLFQNDEPENGTVELIFRTEPLQLSKWVVTDPDANKVYVGLIDVQTGMELPASLFATPRASEQQRDGTK
ncbi:MAG TPA: outer membrane lipoprotein carrier protein LolA [Dongiaceae bacterium]|jgi:outer membrane lipoprotein-sorting protein